MYMGVVRPFGTTQDLTGKGSFSSEGGHKGLFGAVRFAESIALYAER